MFYCTCNFLQQFKKACNYGLNIEICTHSRDVTYRTPEKRNLNIRRLEQKLCNNYEMVSNSISNLFSALRIK